MAKIAYLEVSEEQRKVYDKMGYDQKALVLELLGLATKLQAKSINDMLKGV